MKKSAQAAPLAVRPNQKASASKLSLDTDFSTAWDKIVTWPQPRMSK
jgi:hypothetical protein